MDFDIGLRLGRYNFNFWFNYDYVRSCSWYTDDGFFQFRCLWFEISGFKILGVNK
jgi:hypothetical protein